MTDIMYIDHNLILHIVDEGTHFSAAWFLNNVDTWSIWSVILKFCATIHTRLHNGKNFDKRSALGKIKVFLQYVAILY